MIAQHGRGTLRLLLHSAHAQLGKWHVWHAANARAAEDVSNHHTHWPMPARAVVLIGGAALSWWLVFRLISIF